MGFDGKAFVEDFNRHIDEALGGVFRRADAELQASLRGAYEAIGAELQPYFARLRQLIGG